jgi:flagellar basal-body rod modification protein FlgD
MIDAIGSASGSTAYSPTGQTQMGKEDFLQLLVTQLKHQDPLNPQESTEFVTQLAQFTTLERLTNMENSMMNVAGASMVTNATLAADFIDSTVRAKGDKIHFDGKAQTLHYQLDAESADVKVEVVDSDGKVVKTIEASGDEGANKVVWDGTTDDGGIAEEGDYTFRVTATDADGAEVGTSTSIEAHVEAVKFQGGVPHLVLDNGTEVPLGDTLEVLSKNGSSAEAPEPVPAPTGEGDGEGDGDGGADGAEDGGTETNE